MFSVVATDGSIATIAETHRPALISCLNLRDTDQTRPIRRPDSPPD